MSWSSEDTVISRLRSIFGKHFDAEPVHAFFCHASEDKAVVEQVITRISNAHSELRPWLDKYEIAGGDDFFDRIAEGMDRASIFFVFLSERSIGKPWVRAELHRALSLELSGRKTRYVIPVKVGQIEQVPAFLESRKYIDLEGMTEAEWIAEFSAAIRGETPGGGAEAKENLVIEFVDMDESTNGLAVRFTVRYWAESIGFRVKTSHAITQHGYMAHPELSSPHTSATIRNELEYAVSVPSEKLKPGKQFYLMLDFAEGIDARGAIESVERWDGQGSTTSGIWF